ncbi:MAG TPA: hypothetical protein VIX19_19025 [Terriglobales bacterium]
MLSEQDFAIWAERIGVSNEALSVVAHIRRSDPARRVGGGQANVTGRYPSRKMGVTIQFESHRVELPTVYELEHDDGVLEYWDQPNSIKLDYVGAHGRHLGVLHTPQGQKRDGRSARRKRSSSGCRSATRTDIVAVRIDGFAHRAGRTLHALAFTTEFDLLPILIGFSSGTSSFLKTTCEPPRR